jgi:hypothetical protein
MINASVQNTNIVVSCDSDLNLAPIVVMNLSVGVAVAIHDLGNQLIIFGYFMLQFESLLVVQCIFILIFFHCSIFLFSIFFFSDTQGNGIGSSGIIDFVCSNGQSICFQRCPFDSEHGFIAFLLQQGIQSAVGVGIATRHFPVLKLTHE